MSQVTAAKERDSLPGSAVREPRVRRRLLLVRSHVVQYASPMYREMVRDARLDILVAYCTLQGAQAGVDPEFGVPVSWDEPQLEGYPWVDVPNRSPRPGLGRFFGHFNPGLWSLIRDGEFDAVWVSGYFYASAWIAILAARWQGVPLIFTTDAHNLRTWGTHSQWKQRIKKFLTRHIYGLGAMVLAGSSGTVEYLKSLGVPAKRVILSRNVVDNSWWTERAAQTDCRAVRAAWDIADTALVVLFCAKLQPWKGPGDLLEAFARANLPNLHLVFAGEGPLKPELERQAKDLGVSGRVRFLGFVNQSQLPSVYSAADLFVLPSLYEPFGLVINEAMLCGCPVAISDRVGAKFDLVRDGENGYVFPAHDIGAISAVLQDFFADPKKRVRMSAASRERMKTWSLREYMNALVEAVELAARARR